MPDASPFLPHSGLSLLEARQIANDAGMHLITNGEDVLVSPIVPPGWWIVPIRIKVTAPRIGQPGGRITLDEQVAA